MRVDQDLYVGVKQDQDITWEDGILNWTTN